MLSETKAELDEFHHASKELEAELEAELARTEKAQMDLKVKVCKAESERDDWKVRMQLAAHAGTSLIAAAPWIVEIHVSSNGT